MAFVGQARDHARPIETCGTVVTLLGIGQIHNRLYWPVREDGLGEIAGGRRSAGRFLILELWGRRSGTCAVSRYAEQAQAQSQERNRGYSAHACSGIMLWLLPAPDSSTPSYTRIRRPVQDNGRRLLSACGRG